MIKHSHFSVIASFLGLSFVSFMPSASAGKDLFQPCSSCHGVQGQGMKTLNAPAIGGQLEGYLLRAMEEFSSGTRGTQDAHAEQMATMAPLLQDPKSREQLAIYIAALKPLRSAPKIKSVTGNQTRNPGYKHYQASCGGCHGSLAQGNKALHSPRLAGLEKAYIFRQLKHFSDRSRGSSSRYGKQMQLMATSIRDPDTIKQVLDYIDQQNYIRRNKK